MTFMTATTKAEHLPAFDPNAMPLRVALFSGNYNYVRDGANQSLNRLVAYLERHGIPVRVYAPTVAEPAFPPTGDLVSIPSIAIPRRREYRLGLGLPRKVREDIARFRPTIFHLSSPDLIGNAAQRLARRMDLPVVASYHTRFETYLKYYGLGALEPLAIRCLRSFYRGCDQIYAPSECMAAILRGLDFNDDVGIWTRGVELDRFNPAKRDQAWRESLGFGPKDVVVAFVGRLVLEKGLNFLADVAARLAVQKVPARFLIVGDGPEKAALQERLPQATFTGLLTGEDLARAYASADIFFNPSTTETFGNVTLEAMASGLPAVCVTATGNRSLVTHGKTGFLTKPGSAAENAAALAHLAYDAERRSVMGKAGWQASQRYHWDLTLAQMVGHYYGVLARRAASAAAMTRPAAFPTTLRLVEE